jgi:allantoin racemase
VPTAGAIAGHAVLDALAERIGAANPEGFGAVAIACFGDPGLEAARELCPVPVLGMAEASLEAALALLADAAGAATAEGAGAVVLGGAGLAGLAARIAPRVPVPVLDSLDCLLSSAAAAAAGHPSTPSTGLAGPLGRLLRSGLASA